MDQLPVHLALHGMAVLTISLVAGLLLYRTILRNEDVASWHLVHASVSGRGVMLIAMAAVIDLVVLPSWLLATAVWAVIFFVWTSTAAMVLRAISGDRGLRLEGSVANRSVYLLYLVGTVAIFPACAALIVGFVNALMA
ncbi:MAG: hypothetical protein ACYTHK_02830 [Planctomycetota bacterium]|jgi:hypothetical protein